MGRRHCGGGRDARVLWIAVGEGAGRYFGQKGEGPYEFASMGGGAIVIEG